MTGPGTAQAIEDRVLAFLGEAMIAEGVERLKRQAVEDGRFSGVGPQPPSGSELAKAAEARARIAAREHEVALVTSSALVGIAAELKAGRQFRERERRGGR